MLGLADHLVNLLELLRWVARKDVGAGLVARIPIQSSPEIQYDRIARGDCSIAAAVVRTGTVRSRTDDRLEGGALAASLCQSRIDLAGEFPFGHADGIESPDPLAHPIGQRTGSSNRVDFGLVLSDPKVGENFARKPELGVSGGPEVLGKARPEPIVDEQSVGIEGREDPLDVLARVLAVAPEPNIRNVGFCELFCVHRRREERRFTLVGDEQQEMALHRLVVESGQILEVRSRKRTRLSPSPSAS